MYEIETDIPVPNNIGRGNRESKYPFAHMQNGDSICIPNTKALQAARNAAYLYKKSNPEFNYGAIQYDDGTGRLWRVAP